MPAILRDRRAFVLLSFVCVTACAQTVAAQLEVIGTYYRADLGFPRYRAFWHEDSNLIDEIESPTPPQGADVKLGASLHVHVRNGGRQPLVVRDVMLAGSSLNEVIANSGQRKRKEFANIYFAKLPKPQLQKLIDIGEPVWWKVDPLQIAPGETGEVIVRLRHTPQASSVDMGLVGQAGKMEVAATASVAVVNSAPRIAGISFAPGLSEMFLYFRHPKGHGTAPTKVLMDGREISRHCTISRDSEIDLVPVIARPERPLVPGSYHTFIGEFADGMRAMAGIRAWCDEFAYGMFGGKPGDENQPEIARQYIDDLAAHNINVQMPQLGSAAVQSFFHDPAGKRYFAAHGMRAVLSDIGKWGLDNPFAYYVHDEPDCGDAKAKAIPENKKVGSMARWVISHGDEIREKDPAVPHMLNLDMTFKPTNWYTYGQIPDIFTVDPYYQSRLKTAYTTHPERIPLYLKATYVYAVGVVAQSAAEPRPMHVILNSVRHLDKDNRKQVDFRFATPEEKRIEVYYSLAAGAKGLSYWWYTPASPAYGIGAATSGKNDPEAVTLWREIGLLGAEVRTAGPMLLTSCPIDLPVKTQKNVWVRCLASGSTTLILLLVNEDYRNTDKGTAYTPVEAVSVSVSLPAWMKNPGAFEINAAGTQEVAAKVSAGELRLSLGKLDIARMIVVSMDARLRSRLQAYYASKLAASTSVLLRQ